MTMYQRTALIAFALSLAACGSNKKDEQAQSGPKPTTALKPRDAGVAKAAPPQVDAMPPMKVEPFADDGDETAALGRLGAVRVWHTVINRGKYLARRQKAGAVWGRLGERIDGYTWLIDEVEGGGSLGIRVAFPEGAPVKVGDRLLVLGSWHVDEDKRWFWKPARVARLKPKKLRRAFESVPGHQIIEIEKRPRKAVWVDKVVPQEGGEIVFEVVRGPVRLGDGYRIANRTGWRSEGLLILPGHREPYGGQNLLAPDERWRLERGTRYTLRVAPFWRKIDGMWLMKAQSAPRIIVTKKYRKRKAKEAKEAAKRAKRAKAKAGGEPTEPGQPGNKPKTNK